MNNHQLLEMKEKIIKINSQTSAYMNEIKNLMNEHNFLEKQLHLISYFTYSFNFAHNKKEESLIIASYHIHNIGSKSLTNPYICIKIASESPFYFSGKYVQGTGNERTQPSNTWMKINEQTDKDEFWLKPVNRSTIKPNEKITFSSFQIKWQLEDAYAASILGFTYTDQYKEGITAINPIYLNGN